MRHSTLLMAACIGSLIACETPEQVPPPSDAQSMAERLRQIAHNRDPVSNTYLSDLRVSYLSGLAEPLDPLARLRARILLARERLRAGQTQASIDEFRQLQPEIEQRQVRMQPSLDLLLGTAYMRLGEQVNCLEGHTTASCLFPIGPDGVHADPHGSRMALGHFAAVLEQNPGDLTARWLLNVAYMTLGEYPDQVPPQWLIAPSLFASEHDIGHFPDIAPFLGLDLVSLAGGSIMDDFDNDGFLDLMISAWGLHDQLRYFRNQGDGTFAERTREVGLTGITGGLQLVHADFDNDSWLDFLAVRGAWQDRDGQHPNSLVRNQGDGTFADVTEAAGVLSFHPTQTAAWADIDSDGLLDLFVGNETFPGIGDTHPGELFHNQGDGTFIEKAASLGLATEGLVKGATWGDFDNDGQIDLYVSRLMGDNLLFRNRGGEPADGPRFTDVAGQAGVKRPHESFPTWFWDFDNDGWLDLFASGYHYNPDINAGDVAADYLSLPTNAERARLFRNRGDGTFADVSQTSRLHQVLYTMGCNYVDLDNDGWLDFYVATGSPSLRSVVPNRMFRNASGHVFQDVTASGGFGHLQKGHGVAVGDLDNDGDQDIYAVIGGAYTGDTFQNVLFENPGHGHRWITLLLEGTQANRSAIGARVEVQVETSEGTRSIHRMVSSGASFGASSLQQEIGLGQAAAIREIAVIWPGADEVQRFSEVPLDRTYRVRQGAAALIPLVRRSLSLAPERDGAAGSHEHRPTSAAYQ